MKYILLIFVGIILLNKTKCHVTNRTKIAESTTGFSTNYSVIPVVSGNKTETTKTVRNEVSRVYLEDVVHALKNQNWTAEELPCLNQTLLLLRSLQNFTLWAVWDWDSMSSQPQGLLFGNRYQLGNFDQCMDAPWSGAHPELKTQYCLADIVLERTDHAVRRRVQEPVQPYQSTLDFIQYRPTHMRALNELTWGGCVPACCPPRSVERLMAIMLARSHLGMAGMRPRITVSEPCQTFNEPKEFDGLFYAFIGVMGSLVAIALMCTYLNKKKRTSHPEAFKHEIIKAFCIKENAMGLLDMKKEGFEVLYGIRFLTICLIVVDHQIGIFNSGPVSNGLQVDKDSLSPVGMLVLHDDLFVDTFFLLSGLLLSTAIHKFKKLPNPFLFILKRYIRLVVCLAVVIFFLCAAFPFVGSGPLWSRAVAGDTDQCRKNWWLSLLMLSNYIDSENICIVVSWYIPCDFHYFVVSVLVYWMYERVPKLGAACAAALAVASVVAPGVINYVNRLPAVQLFTYDFIKNPRGSEQFHLTYIKSHTRLAAYVVGFFSGYIYSSYKASGNLKRFSQKRSVLGACVGLAIMTAVMFLGTTYLWRSYHPIEGAAYAALNRPLWACGVMILILCCSQGYVPFVSSFLTWYPWAPLSRLSYGLYLTHTAIIARNVFVTRNPQHNDYLELLISSVGVIFLGCVSALAIWLVAEAPANNLITICLKPRVKKYLEPEIATPVTQSTSVVTIASGSSGHLPANLPETIEISSKI